MRLNEDLTYDFEDLGTIPALVVSGPMTFQHLTSLGPHLSSIEGDYLSCS